MTDDTVTLAERKALNWYRVNGPAEISATGTPQRPIRIALVRRGFLQISPLRSMGDPIKYDLTDKGRERLKL